MSAGPWKVEGRQTYNGRHYWVVWKHNPKFYGGQQCLMNADRTDAKRFYGEAKAEAEAVRLNKAQQADDSQKGGEA
jgi:hypothetical protein